MRAAVKEGRAPEAGVQKMQGPAQMDKRLRKTVEVNKPVVIARIRSGLGNQIFKYAHALSVAKKFDLELKLDLSWFFLLPEKKQSMDTPRIFRLNEFQGFRFTQATEGELAFFRSRRGKALDRWNRFLIRKQRRPIYRLYFGEHYFRASDRFSGFIGEEFFKDISSSVRDCFKFPPLQSEAGRRTAALIRGEPASVALHVRCGDYLDFSGHCILAKTAYYAKAMEFVETRVLNPRYFIFSDDISFCKSFFQGKDAYFVEGCASDMEEMHLMSLCDHSIIANSTFSWWGAWLGADKQIVVAPCKWYNDERRNEQTKRDGVYPDAWHVLEF